MDTYGIRLPDTGRNTALAGKTVSSGGMNITYNERGFVETMSNYGHKAFANTERSVRAPSAEAVLAAGSDRGGYGGSSYDKTHFTAKELAHADTLRQWATDGVMTKAEADYWIDDIRRKYGYTGGSTGMEYVAVIFPKEPEETVADKKVYADPAPANPVVTAPAVQNPANPVAAAPVAQSPVSPVAAAPVERRVAVAAEQVEKSSPWQDSLEQLSRQESLLGELRTAAAAALAQSGERQSDGLLSALLSEDEEDT